MRYYFPLNIDHYFSFLVIVSSSLKAQRFTAGVMIGGDVSQVDGDTYSGYTQIWLSRRRLMLTSGFTPFLFPDGA